MNPRELARAVRRAFETLGDAPTETKNAALLRMAGDDLWQALLDAANIGGDTDSIGAIAGAMGGATGGRLPSGAVAQVMAANALDLAPVARALVAVRHAQEVA